MGTVIIIVIIVIIIIWINSGSSSKKTYTLSYKPTTPKTDYLKIIRDQEEKEKREEREQISKLKKQEYEKIKADNERRKYLQRQARYKSDWQDFKTILDTNNIYSLFHFTDRANLQSIQRHGALYSWHYCFINKIEIPVPGGGELSRQLDRRKGLQNYVRISFTRSHPMMYIPKTRAQNCVILEIDPEVIFWHNTKYANKNATRNDVNVGETLDDFKKIKFDIVKLRNHFDLDEETKPYYQGEILILEKIPAEFILNLNNFTSQSIRNNDLPF